MDENDLNADDPGDGEGVPDRKPSWWRENEKLKRELDLPAYEPPRFADGTYTYEVVTELEDGLDCNVRFVGVDVEANEGWQVRVDGDSVLTLGRHRDNQGNTVYEIDAQEFRERVETELTDT